MARPRASERADYGLVYLMSIDAFHKDRISLEQLGEVVHGYGAALEAYRSGAFDPYEIGVPSVYAFDPEAWRKHLECFIDGINKTEKARAKKRGAREQGDAEDNAEGDSLGVSPSKTDNKSKGEVKVKERKEKKSEGNSRAGARELPPSPPSPPSGNISPEISPMSFRAYEDMSLLTRSHNGEKPYDPVTLAMRVCQLPPEDTDNRRPFGKELARVGPLPFLDAVDKCYKAALADRKAVTPSVLQRAFADLPAAEAS